MEAHRHTDMSEPGRLCTHDISCLQLVKGMVKGDITRTKTRKAEILQGIYTDTHTSLSLTALLTAGMRFSHAVKRLRTAEETASLETV